MKTKLILFLFVVYCTSLYSQVTYDDYVDFARAGNQRLFDNWDKDHNLLIEGNVIHIFINDKGSLIGTGIPTTATDKNLYKIHLIAEDDDNEYFKISVNGDYTSTLNIKDEQKQYGVISPFVAADPLSSLKEYVYPTVGPFTEKFSFEVKKVKTSGGTTVESSIRKADVKIAKLYHVSISTGIFMTTLQDPTNIKESFNSNGERTLIADDPNNRGIVVLNAVFYPKGRSFLFPPSQSNFWGRCGLLVGTRLDKDQFENFLGGVQYDIARGGSISAGIHYGRRNKVVGYNDFDFGKDIFEGDLEKDIVKEWDVGLFLGINLDVRIFGQLFGGAN